MYLTMEFLYKIPPSRDDASDIANIALKLSSISNRLANEDRTAVNHFSGRAENVAEHSMMLSLVAPIIAEYLYPELDPNLISRFASIHDIVEAYSGDTPTHIISTQDLKDKEILEKTALEKLTQDFSDIPGFVSLVNDYEDQIIPEARFVRVLDKSMPLLVHFSDNGATLRSYNTPEGVRNNSSERSKWLRKDYPEFIKIIELREELANLAAEHLFEE